MLFLKELKKVVASITFIVFIVATIAFLASQDVMNFSDMQLTPPQQGMDYGTQKKEVPELIMPAAFASLYNEFMENNYMAYPIGFYKNVKLNDKEQERMAEIISALSGISVNDLLSSTGRTVTQDKIEITLDGVQNYTEQEDGSVIVDENNNNASERTDNIKVALRDGISYEAFKEYMQQADDLIGGGSRYCEDYLLDFSYVPVTFEEAQEQYNLAANTDHFTGVFARLFCDYCGFTMSILPVFIAVAMCIKDRRARMDCLIYPRKISSFGLVFARYFAILAAVILPTIFLAYISNISMWGLYDGLALDYLAPLKYVAGWLMPSAMIAIAVGMLFTELTGTPIAIAIQGIWWFVDINASVARLDGYQSLFQLIPRHNSYGNTQIFIDNFNTLVTNRVLYAGAALILVFITVIIYEQKRRGKINGFGKIAKLITNMANRKDKSAA